MMLKHWKILHLFLQLFNRKNILMQKAKIEIKMSEIKSESLTNQIDYQTSSIVSKQIIKRKMAM